ncbi:DUF1071 domain-containing protein [Staphylococcus saprophyticus]|uniref:Sak single strand annealing protein n=1 Tax=Staphylococcus saprophyticus TaxID=29385 RepID=UPI0034DD6292
MTEQTLFQQLNSMNVNDHVEKKQGLSYLAWSYAHQELMKIDPNYEMKIHEYPHPEVANEQYFVPYLASPEGYSVTVSITLKGLTKTETLPVLDFKNKSVPYKQADMFQINKTYKRAFVKAAALHGIGLYIYHGEDAPDESENLRQELMNEIQRFTDLLIVKGTEITPDEVKQKFQIGDISKLSQSDAIGHIKLIRANAQKLKENE